MARGGGLCPGEEGQTVVLVSARVPWPWPAAASLPLRTLVAVSSHWDRIVYDHCQIFGVGFMIIHSRPRPRCPRHR